MIRSSRSSSASQQHQPIYREVLRHAFKTAWEDRHIWILSLFAGILFTAGSYDILWRAVTSINEEGGAIVTNVGAVFVQTVSQVGSSASDRIISVIGGLETLGVIVLLTVAFLTVSCIAQGALVFALGARRHGKDVNLADALRVGARAFWPIVALNASVFAVLWILRFLVALPLYLALDHTTSTTYLVYLVSFVVFVPLAFTIAILEVFTLNAMILQGAPLADGVRRSWLLLKRHWVVVVETAAIQAVLAIGIWILFVLAILVLLIPSFILFLTAVISQSNAMFVLALIIGGIFSVSGLLVTAAFTVQLQYATWTYLYRRLGEGGVVPKLHRVVRNLFNNYHVPQS